MSLGRTSLSTSETAAASLGNFGVAPLPDQPNIAFAPEKPPVRVESITDGWSFVSSNPAMLALRQQIEKIANYDIPVLILGESGTGKEVLARLIHSRSSRAKRRFLKVNCAALPGSLLESELFGYERGAFTGAVRSNPGKFELCDSGTILLDEIGEMPPELQAKLLHVLQDGIYSRVGGHELMKANSRVIAATNVDIAKALESGRLRQDLYYRLNAFTLRIPPLRSRVDEIPFLLDYFAKRYAADYDREPAGFSRKLQVACMEYPWPGNVRELQNFAQRLLIQGDEQQAIVELQGCERSGEAQRVVSAAGAKEVASLDLKQLARELKSKAEKPTIEKALQDTRYNRKAAARQLKISYKGLLLKLREYGLDGKNTIENLAVQG